MSAHKVFNDLLVSRLFLATFHCSLFVQVLPSSSCGWAPWSCVDMVNRIGCWIGLALLVSACSGCGVLYTVVKSESKLDRLAVPMTKAEVIDQIGRPDRVLRDDGGDAVCRCGSRPRVRLACRRDCDDLIVGFGHQYGRTSQARRSVQRTGRPTTIRR